MSPEEDAPESGETAAVKPEPDEGMIENLRMYGFSYEGAYRSVEATGDAESALEYALTHNEDSNFNDPLPHQLNASALAEGAGGQSGPRKKKKKARLIPLELQRLFSKMRYLDCASLSTEELTTKGFQWQGMDGRIQHDAHELNR